MTGIAGGAGIAAGADIAPGAGASRLGSILRGGKLGFAGMSQSPPGDSLTRVTGGGFGIGFMASGSAGATSVGGLDRGFVPSTLISALHFLQRSDTTRPATRRS
jgi:hypothetical protein